MIKTKTKGETPKTKISPKCIHENSDAKLGKRKNFPIIHSK